MRAGRATRSMRTEYRQLRRRMERIQRDDWRRWVDSRCDAAKSAADTGNTKELYSIVRQLGGKSQAAPLYPVEDSNGKRVTIPEDVAKVHAEFLHNKFSLGDFDSTGVDATPDESVADNLVDISPPTWDEIAAAVKFAKSNKAADDDRITADLLKAAMLLSTVWAGLKFVMEK